VTAPLFFVDPESLAADRIIVAGDEGRHAADVRRLRVGEVVDVGDGRGRLARGAVAEVTRGRLAVDVHERCEVPSPELRLVVVQALAKGGRDVDAIEAMTEVGVDEVVAWTAARSVARPSDNTVSRWLTMARAASKQAHRAWIPTISGPADTDEVIARAQNAALTVVLHETATSPIAVVELPTAGDVVLVVGPEGGLTEDETEAFAQAGALVCRLGDTVLRTSTAGVAALSVLSAQGRWR